MKVYVGHDDAEPEASRVAVNTLWKTSGQSAELLDERRLRDVGLLTRPVDRRGSRYDLVSNARASTDFAISRFLVPIICQDRSALFVDGDVVFLRDVAELAPYLDKHYAVSVVKHEYVPTQTMKMDGQPQTEYGRKNWSSVMLFNCHHPANARLTLHDVNTRRGLWLHQLGWLADSEIGTLPADWNWLVNDAPEPKAPAIAHFTNGGPFIAGWKGAEHDDLWLKAAQ